VQRAIESCLQTGGPFRAKDRSGLSRLPWRRGFAIIALNPPRQKLYERINQRTEEHFRKRFGR